MAKDDPTGRIEEPRFRRGFDPLTAPHWKAPLKPFPWQRHIDLLRQNPQTWALVSEVRQGGCKARLEIIKRDRQKIEGWLLRHFPLERWQLRLVTVAGTHCDRELWMRYLCELTPEEDRLDRAERRQRYLARQEIIQQRRVQRADVARQEAREAEAAEKLRIRARRRPGQ